MVNIGVLGAGHLGKIHIKLLKGIPSFNLVGFYDVNRETSAKVSNEFGLKAFSSMESLLEEVDALDIVVPTIDHYASAIKALKAGKHIFIEKPLTENLQEGLELLRFAVKHPHLVIQVGHVERFNPAFLAISERKLSPMFIEGHRLAVYNPRGTDVSVVLDLMIHDLDIVLSLISSPVKRISASGVAVVSDSPDITNARIEFENNAVANLTASRVSMKNMRKLRMFQKDAYLSVDFLEKRVEAYEISTEAQEGLPFPSIPIANGQGTRYVNIAHPVVSPVNSIELELKEFAASVLYGGPIRVGIKDAYRALEVAHLIVEEISTTKPTHT
ncbi:MAG: Gfo/Idh/MocA family oxidoreductase [Bacteroidia bacterium]|nr:Gfo/Idh/MocA family oxidoreductase [Bacteroidia bacterium]